MHLKILVIDKTVLSNDKICLCVALWEHFNDINKPTSVFIAIIETINKLKILFELLFVGQTSAFLNYLNMVILILLKTYLAYIL